MHNDLYNRVAAVTYAEQWAMGRNPAYFDFHGIGGDCTNFASQCLYAGSGVMNYTPVTGWYYITPSERTASWTGVEFLSDFLVSNRGPGPYGHLADRSDMMPGDIIQLGRSDGTFYHTPVVLGVTPEEIYVATHTYDTLWRPLSTYHPTAFRYIHIDGVRRP